MQGTRFGLALFSAVAALAISPAYAIMSAPDGWYAEGNVGKANIANDTLPGSHSQTGVSGNLNVGYKFMPFFGMEIGYSRFASMTIKDGEGNKAGDASFYSYDLAGKGIVPIVDSGFELFAKVGVNRMNQHISINDNNVAASIGLTRTQHSNTNYYLGLGAQYYFIPEMAGVLQWQHSEGNSSTGDADFYSVGLSFIFA